MSYKLYSIIPSSPTGSISIVTEIMKISSSKYSEDLTPREETRAKDYYPSRIVTSSIVSSSFKRLGIYQLTDAEANEIKNDPLISSVTALTTSSFIPTTSSTIPNRNVRAYQKKNYTQNIDRGQLISTATYYHSLPLEDAYSGPFGRDTFTSLGGGYEYSAGLPPNIDSFSLIKDINYNLDGEGVDIIIWEGKTSAFNSEGIEYCHSEYYGRDGKSRIKFADWNLYDTDVIAGVKNPTVWDHFYTTEKPSGAPQHRQRVSACAAGLVSGFAKGSDIYFFPYTIGGYQEISITKTLDIFLNFDQNKPINPKTGRRNRTVINCSWAPLGESMFLNPYAEKDAHLSQKSSSSIDFSPSSLQYNEGIRIMGNVSRTPDYGKYKDFIFISSSVMSEDTNITINGIPDIADIYYYTSSHSNGLEGLADALNTKLGYPVGSNNTPAYCEATASGNTLIITSSGGSNGVYPFQIYTGSVNDFILTSSLSTPKLLHPRGGHLLRTFGDYNTDSHISKIVVKGNTVYTSSSEPDGVGRGLLNSDHGYYANRPTDQYGIDRIIFTQYTSPKYPNLTTDAGYSSAIRPTIPQAFMELALAGVVVVMSAGNGSSITPQSMRSSSLEENELYDPLLYDEGVWNTYIELDTPYGSGQGHEMPSYTPLRLSTPMWGVDNYSAIKVGQLQLNLNYLNSRVYTSGGSPYLDSIRTFASKSLYDYNTDPNSTLNNIGKISPMILYAHGPAISTYALSGTTINIGTKSSTYSGFMGTSSAIYNTIDIDTSSFNTLYSPDYMTESLAASTKNPNGTLIHTEGMWAEYDGGGTSFSSPLVAGMVACFLGANPDASFKDARNWLHTTGHSVLPNFSSPSNKYHYRGIYETSSLHPAYYNDLYVISGGLDLGGRNGIIAHFPYNSPIKGKLSNINISKS
jgi:hypothetical protein